MVSVTTVAGEDSTVAATSGKSSSNHLKNNVVPPVVKESYEYYEVCGCCEKDLHSDLKQKCIKWKDGRKYDSVTNWKVKRDYGHNRTPQVCTTDSFMVTVDVVFHLPKWAQTGDASPPLVEKWDRYMEKLRMHEQGHRDRAVVAATELTRAVAELPPASTCDVLDREVHNLFRSRLDKLIKDQEEYDNVTNHGVAQGAVFP
jgi:predicted secreted Zn-dependent protease